MRWDTRRAESQVAFPISTRGHDVTPYILATLSTYGGYAVPRREWRTLCRGISDLGCYRLDHRLEVATLHIVLDAIAVLLRREPGFRPLAGIDTQPRPLDVLVCALANGAFVKSFGVGCPAAALAWPRVSQYVSIWG